MVEHCFRNNFKYLKKKMRFGKIIKKNLQLSLLLIYLVLSSVSYL